MDRIKRILTSLTLASILPLTALADSPSRLFGLSCGYAFNQYHITRQGGQTLNSDVCAQPGHMNGIEMGVTVQPRFSNGFGLDTGIFYDYYYTRKPEKNWTVHEQVLYIPAHMVYTLPIAKAKVDTHLLAGPSLSWTMAMQENRGRTDLKIVPESQGWPRRAQIFAEIGAGINWNRFQLDFLWGWGLLKETTMLQPIDKAIRQHAFRLQLAVLF